MNRSEFPEQLRLAIADLIRDMEITKQCYEKGYNNHWSIDLNTAMWKDVQQIAKNIYQECALIIIK